MPSGIYFRSEKRMQQLRELPNVRWKNHKKMEATCAKCGKTYNTFPSVRQKYCSKDCWSKRNPPIEKNCEWCGKAFSSFVCNKQIFCSKKCVDERKSVYFKGENAPRWIDGRSLKKERGILAHRLKLWRLAVLKRDKYKCQKCGQIGKNLHAHHIIPWADDKSKRLDVENGLTVCADCHDLIHGRVIGRKNAVGKKLDGKQLIIGI